MGGGFAQILLLFTLMLGAQATHTEVAERTPFGKAMHQHNFDDNAYMPSGLTRAGWTLPKTNFAEIMPADLPATYARPRDRQTRKSLLAHEENAQTWDDASFMAVGNRQRAVPEPPVAVFDNPAAAIDPAEEEFPDTTTAESEDSDSEDPNWQLSALFATNGQVAQIQVNLVSIALQRHQIARALGWNDAEIVNIHRVEVRPRDLVQQRVHVRLIQHTRDPPSHSDMRLVLLDITLHPPAPRRDAQYFRVACNIMEQITIQQLLTVLRLRNVCSYTRLPCLAWRNEVYWSLHSEEVVSLASGDYLRLEIAPPNDEQGCCDTRCLITMMEEGYDPEHGVIYQTIVDEIYWWRIPSRVLRIHQPIVDDESSMLQQPNVHFLSRTSTCKSDQPTKWVEPRASASAPKQWIPALIVRQRGPGIQATPGDQNAWESTAKLVAKNFDDCAKPACVSIQSPGIQATPGYTNAWSPSSPGIQATPGQQNAWLSLSPGIHAISSQNAIPTERIGEATNPGPIIGTTNPCGALGKASMFDANRQRT